MNRSKTTKKSIFLKQLYQDLSKYVHCTYDEMLPFLQDGVPKARIIVHFKFQQALFDRCRTLTNHTLDAVYFTILSGIPEIKKTLKTFITVHMNSESPPPSLKSLQCDLTLKLLQS